MIQTKTGVFVAASWDELGITIPYGKSGQFKMKCPKCKDSREKNKSDEPLSADTNEQIALCHHCSASFALDKKGYLAHSNVRQYKLPEQHESYDLVEPKVLEWFSGRGISAETLRKLKVTSGKAFMPQVGAERNAILFNYFDRDQLVNVKYRDGDKNFRLHGGSKLIFYNLNALYEADGDIIITEGEMDAASYIEAGRSNVISVPNGASKGSMKLEYLDNCYHLFDNEWRAKNHLKPITRVLLATDDDDPGKMLRDEFVRRLHAHRCYFVEFDGANDPNELLENGGKVALFSTIEKSKPAPLTDVVLVGDLSKELAELQKNGLQPGAQVGTDMFKRCFSFEQPRMTIITGVSTHGKSEYLDDIMCRLAIEHKWTFAVFSPENFPIEYHISKMVSKLVGKEFNKIKGLELQQAYDFISRHFFWIYPENNDYTLGNILRITDMLISRYGVNGLVIDPWTEIDKGGKSGTEDINELLSNMNQFKRDRNCHIFLVAHPTKMPKDPSTGLIEVPDLMNISGSA
jgi:twinkle protein